MDPRATRPLGRTGVQLTQLGLGGASIGSLHARVTEAEALATVHQALEEGIRLFDTAPWYGRGLGELRMGAGLRDAPRVEIVLSSKVGRWLRPAADPTAFDPAPWTGGNPFEAVFDYSYDGIMRSFDQSLQRLGAATIDLAVIHDLDFLNHESEEGVAAREADLRTSGWRALEELRRAGRIRAIGAGINQRVMIERWLAGFDLDFFLIAMPYTLLDQAVLDHELPRIAARGIGVIVGSVFASGILATGPIRGATYGYAPASDEVMARTARIGAVCDRHGVPLAAAALQFPLGHPAVAAVIPGAFRPEHVRRNVAAFQVPIPADLWAELKHEGLLHPAAPVPREAGWRADSETRP